MTTMSQNSSQHSQQEPRERTQQRQPQQGGISELEKRIELLEPRFTTPAAGGPSPLRSEVANFGTSGSPADSRHSHNASSQHSFTFSTPLSKEGQSNLSSASTLPATSVRSKKRDVQSHGYQALREATDRHMRRLAQSTPPVAPSLPVQRSGKPPVSVLFSRDSDGSKSLSTLPSPPVSAVDASPQSETSTNTLLTSHVQRQKRNRSARIVAESPAVPVSPHPNGIPHPTTRPLSTPSKPAAARSLVLGQASVTPSSKRKSTPKRKQTSLIDKSLPAGRVADSQQPRGAKRTRLTVTEENCSSSSNNNSNGKGKQALSTLTESLSVASESSRDRSNSQSNSKRPKSGPPVNNKFISDFFTTATGTTAGGAMPVKKKRSPTNAVTTTVQAPSLAQSPSASITQSRTCLSAEYSDVFEEMKEKIRTMELQLREKDEQLKALANNRTILHTALESALNKAKARLTEAEQASAQRDKEYAQVLEDLLRWKSTQQAKDVRAKLAAEGTRLGRIVYARAGMRAVESWEEGQATKELEHKKIDLRRKRKLIEGSIARSQHADSAVENARNDKGVAVGDDKLLALQRIEERAALHMQLESVKRQEADLADSERKLNDEKGAHIRALKRVASEDASRFSSRPKLNDRYVLHCLLGKGGFSEVWRAYDLKRLREVAVKIHQLDPRWPDAKKENYTKHVSREYEIHRNVRHPRIVSLYDVFEIDTNSFATVLECCKGTDLDTMLKERRCLPEREAKAILLQILTGMQYLSQGSSDGSRQGIIHYDLKPGNILFDELGYVKITDFGLSKIVDAPDPAESMELTSQGAGTYWYLPPECFVTSEKVRISNKVDVWSIGVIYYQMLFGKRPFGEGKSQDRLLTDHTMLNAHSISFPSTPTVSDVAKRFIEQCLTYDQTFRPNIGQLCEHSYVLGQQE